MADEKKAAETAEPAAEEAPKKKINLKALIMVGGCLAAQAVIVLVVLFFARAANETPQVAVAAEVSTEPDMVEISVIPNNAEEKIKAINAKKGRLIYWGLKVFLQIRAADVEHVKAKLITNENFVKQEIARIVSDCEPFLLEQEADHATLKRQIRYALNGVLGKGTINQVLISECIPATLD